MIQFISLYSHDSKIKILWILYRLSKVQITLHRPPKYCWHSLSRKRPSQFYHVTKYFSLSLQISLLFRFCYANTRDRNLWRLLMNNVNTNCPVSVSNWKHFLNMDMMEWYMQKYFFPIWLMLRNFNILILTFFFRR